MKFSSSDEIPLFSERPEWSDVQPLAQYEDANPIAPIFYTEEYKDATNYFRAIVRANEKSPRVLELTENIIRQNPAHYSAWQYRYETLLALLPPAGADNKEGLPPLLATELGLMDELAVLFLKTYQVWHHRRLLVPLTKQPARELAFIKRGLEVDAKNYHTWSYRQWLLASCYGPGAVANAEDEIAGDAADVWAAELDFVDAMLAEDVRNNSAWHHRFFVVFGSQGPLGDGPEKDRIVKRELIYVKQSISLAPSNPSSWNYLRGVLKHINTPFASEKEFVRLYTYPRSEAYEKRDIVDLDDPPPSDEAELPCVQAMEFMADIWEVEGISGKSQEPIQKAVDLWKVLASEYDPIRKRYWEHRIRDAHRALPA